VDALARLVDLWDECSDEDRQSLAMGPFEEIAYDLDAERIVGFKLKLWVQQFLLLRGDLYRGAAYSSAPSRNSTPISTGCHSNHTSTAVPQPLRVCEGVRVAKG
jgi:hypothetical protein